MLFSATTDKLIFMTPFPSEVAWFLLPHQRFFGAPDFFHALNILLSGNKDNPLKEIYTKIKRQYLYMNMKVFTIN